MSQSDTPELDKLIDSSNQYSDTENASRLTLLCIRIERELTAERKASVEKDARIGELEKAERLRCEAIQLTSDTVSERDRALAACAAKDAALRQIADIEPRPFGDFPSDWQEQIAACEECQGWAKNHPVQRGICNVHRKPLYARERHEKHEEAALGYRAKQIARDALSSTAGQGYLSPEEAQKLKRSIELLEDHNRDLANERDAFKADKEDAERLAWLNSKVEAYGFEDIHEGNRWSIEGPFYNLRQAIDAARSREVGK